MVPRVKSDMDYYIRPNYHIYPYKGTVKHSRNLQITDSVLFVYFFIKAYVVGTYLNYIDNICFYKENQEKKTTTQKHCILASFDKSIADLFKVYL